MIGSCFVTATSFEASDSFLQRHCNEISQSLSMHAGCTCLYNSLLCFFFAAPLSKRILRDACRPGIYLLVFHCFLISFCQYFFFTFRCFLCAFCFMFGLLWLGECRFQLTSELQKVLKYCFCVAEIFSVLFLWNAALCGKLSFYNFVHVLVDSYSRNPRLHVGGPIFLLSFIFCIRLPLH